MHINVYKNNLSLSRNKLLESSKISYLLLSSKLCEDLGRAAYECLDKCSTTYDKADGLNVICVYVKCIRPS